MEYEYTEGPWEYHKYPSTSGGNSFSIRHAKHRGIVIAGLTACGTTDRIEPVAEANARLIACAPELLEACDLLMDCVVEAAQLGTFDSDVFEKARSVIAKAKGES